MLLNPWTNSPFQETILDAILTSFEAIFLDFGSKIINVICYNIIVSQIYYCSRRNTVLPKKKAHVRNRGHHYLRHLGCSICPPGHFFLNQLTEKTKEIYGTARHANVCRTLHDLQKQGILNLKGPGGRKSS